MVSFQNHQNDLAEASATSPQPDSTQPQDGGSSNEHEQSGAKTNQYNVSRDSKDLPGFQGTAASDSAEASTNQDRSRNPERIQSILRPGGRSPSSNPFRNKQNSSIVSVREHDVPMDPLSRMHLDASTANNPWSSALGRQRTPQTAQDTSKPLNVLQTTGERESTAESGAYSQTNNSQSQANSQGAAASGKPPAIRDDYSHIFDGNHTWHNVDTSTSQINTSKTNKTAKTSGSDQDDWNMIDSETSSIAGNGKQHGMRSEPGATAPNDDAATIPISLLPQPSFSEAKSQSMESVATPSPKVPATHLDGKGMESSSAEDDIKEQPQRQAGEGIVEKASVPSLLGSKDELKKEAAIFIEPIGSEAPAQPSQPKEEPQIGGLLPEKEERPALPPRKSQPVLRWSSTRQVVDGKAETYQIKKISWHDSTWSSNPRISPILVQSENGPCPLVALVNALSLTTPADIAETNLVQVLGSRERVSLSLVLDAVFDELMSPRRTSSEVALPDMSELYDFLQSLHTGMNVNPRFIPTEEMLLAYRESPLTDLQTSERDGIMPGTFENSLEMKLYITFSIPLIHGWLPAKSDAAYGAFERQAATYEDAQNLLFREEELEAKLSDPQHGLSGPEQQLYEDVMAIKLFMNDSATQLTPWGIEVISRAMRPGTFAILFRNDHFSTLYRHPDRMQLLTLVTDAGYSSHKEVVWESLADVNGELSELYSGDFQPVGSCGIAGPSSGSQQPIRDGSGEEWTKVPNRRGKDRQQELNVEASTSPSAGQEQEDGDLALALQLQEEEEEKQRAEQARRRQESRLSEQFIEQQGRQRPQPVARNTNRLSNNQWAGRPLGMSSHGRTSSSSMSVSSGRNNSTMTPSQPPRTAQTQQIVRPLVPPATEVVAPTARGRQGVNRPTTGESGDEAPPSYEAAQHDRRVVATSGLASASVGANANSNVSSVSLANTNGGSGMMAGPRLGTTAGGPRPGYGRGAENMGLGPTRLPGGRIGQGGREKERDCVVM